MTSAASQVQNFYSEIKFPGLYSFDDLQFYRNSIHNNFLSIYNDGVKGCGKVLDVGCGTGFITSLLAIKNPGIKFDALDFSDSIEYAQRFAVKNKIKNVNYFKEDFFNFYSEQKYDCIVCNGVIHHMPDYRIAIEKIKNMIKPNGKLILGVYNSYGKTAKKILPVKYRSELLRTDQEDVPYEISFTNDKFLNYFPEYTVDVIYPSISNHFVDLRNLLNYKNGGLTIYNLQRVKT